MPMGDGGESPSRRSAIVLRVCVGVQDEGLNGIETYSEQVAIAAAHAGHDVTLIVTTPEIADAVRARTRGQSNLRVVDAGLAPRTPRVVMAGRLLPDVHTERVGEALARVVSLQPRAFDVFHLNRPALAPYAKRFGKPVFVAGWFFPHAPGLRLRETWRHTRGLLPRRLGIAVKSFAYYLGDQRGYQSAIAVVACTETLAAQLRSQGLYAVSCPPPVQVTGRPSLTGPQYDGSLRLLVCSGDLSHPRKNLRHAVQAAGLLAHTGRNVVLRAIGRNPEELIAEAARLPRGARLELVGPKTPTEVHEEMRNSHALLLPSLYEEWGYVAVESMLSGTPVVTYPVYPFADKVSNPLGIVAESMDPRSLADAVERSLGTPRGVALAAAGEAHFGAAALGKRLTRIWLGQEAEAAARPSAAPVEPVLRQSLGAVESTPMRPSQLPAALPAQVASA